MDRFFSKLDLRDIKIDPFKTSFPPDAEDDDHHPSAPDRAEATAADPPPGHDARPEAADAAGRQGRPRHVPAWAAADPAHARPPQAVVEAIEISTTVAVGAPLLNGHVNGAALVGVNGHAAGHVANPDAHLFDCGDVLKVSARSRPSAVAGAIAGVVREHGRAEVQAIGAGATNQAVKAVAIARDYLRETGIEAVCLPAFIDVTIENEDRTAIRLVIEPR